MRASHVVAAALMLAGACRPAASVPLAAPPAPATPTASPRTPGGARQLVVVTTPAWDSIGGELRRYTRAGAGEPWRLEGAPVPVVVGRTGLAWGGDSLGGAREPRKREGDGRAPAGMFPLDTAFGFAPRESVPWVRLPYAPLLDGSECVDDQASAHYNTVVDRNAVPAVDWTSAEPMRRIDQYRLGVIVGYNAGPVRRGRGSCIFLHIWAGPRAPTAGCTAFDARELETLVRWLDPERRPTLVQLPAAEYERLRARWDLP